MEDYSIPYQTNKQLPFVPFLNAIIALSALFCIWSCFLLFYGYGTLQLSSLPKNATVRINGHQINGTTIRLHPGTYQVDVASPATNPLMSTVSVGMLQTVQYHPQLSMRYPDSVVSSAIGEFAGQEPVRLSHAQWLDNNSWLVGTVGTNVPIALNYEQASEQWAAVYFAAPGYPQGTTRLPTEITAAITALGASNVSN